MSRFIPTLFISLNPKDEALKHSVVENYLVCYGHNISGYEVFNLNDKSVSYETVYAEVQVTVFDVETWQRLELDQTIGLRQEVIFRKAIEKVAEFRETFLNRTAAIELSDFNADKSKNGIHVNITTVSGYKGSSDLIENYFNNRENINKPEYQPVLCWNYWKPVYVTAREQKIYDLMEVGTSSSETEKAYLLHQINQLATLFKSQSGIANAIEVETGYPIPQSTVSRILSGDSKPAMMHFFKYALSNYIKKMQEIK